MSAVCVVLDCGAVGVRVVRMPWGEFFGPYCEECAAVRDAASVDGGFDDPREGPPDPRPVLLWYVTGTYHGSHVYARSEGDARRAFHAIHRQPVPCTASGVGATRAQCDTLLAH